MTVAGGEAHPYALWLGWGVYWAAGGADAGETGMDAEMSSPAGPTLTPNTARPVIFDVGLHHGEDTDFYLRKGFDVVAVEADPRHVAKAKERFAGPLAEGRLEIVSAAVADEPGEIEFYVNLDKDDWGSTDPAYGARSGTRHEKIRVPAIRFEDLYRRIAATRRVHYVKIDIEGGDYSALRGLMKCDGATLPKFVSCEAHRLEYAAMMAVMGYTKFKVVNQNLNWTRKLPNPPQEGWGGAEGKTGEWFEYQFKGHSSGPFGAEAPGEWMSFEQAAELYLAHKRMATMSPTITNAWHDFHGKRYSLGTGGEP